MSVRIAAALAASLASLVCSPNARAEHQVELPAGSVDGLAGAIARAGEEGTVIVKAGIHTESGTVVITSPVKILGEPGAVIESGTAAVFTPPVPVIPTLHILGTQNVEVSGLQFRPTGALANAAVLIEKSCHVRVLDNTITGFFTGVVVQFGNHATITGNTLANVPYLGIIIVNGASARVAHNTVSGSGFGIFCSDRDGVAEANQVSSCYVGLMFCHMDPGALNISGDVGGARTECSGWHAEGNTSMGNAWGYQVIDGSHENMLVNNAASGNSDYDIELAGQTTRYGFLAPTSHDNVVVAGDQQGLVVKDCGNNDTIIGDVSLVDKTLDPCN